MQDSCNCKFFAIAVDNINTKMEYSFGKILKELREDKGILQSALGEILNVANNTISSWERNNSEPSIEQLRIIAKYFGVTGCFLLGLEN